MGKLTIREARQEAVTRLQGAGIDTAALDARVLLAFVLDVSQTGLLTRDADSIEADHLQRYRELIRQRAYGVPVAYLVGEREFMGLGFRITADVLVPRPDTEPLVEWGLAWLREHPHALVADIGTGSGAIALSLTYHAPPDWSGHTIATDTSTAALAVARENADSLLLAERRQRIRFAQGNLTAPITEPVHLLLANLPYLTPDQIAGNPHLAHEPTVALDGGSDGLDLIRAVVDDLSRVLQPGGAVGFEIDPSQSAALQRLLRRALPGRRIEVVHDLAGDERHIVAS
jgi:release factor glutamine methyltransferase